MLLNMKKRVNKNDKFTVTEVGTLIEAMRREFKPILEDIPSIKTKLDSVFEQVGKNTEDTQLIKHILSNHGEEIKSIKHTLNEHGKILNEHGKILNEHGRILNEHGRILNEHSGLLNHILEELKSKVSRSEFELLEKKVASIAG